MRIIKVITPIAAGINDIHDPYAMGNPSIIKIAPV